MPDPNYLKTQFEMAALWHKSFLSGQHVFAIKYRYSIY